ncbi:MAG: 1-acyl-sn-glycerol-3-phosphate acyltransferase [Gammaproteobacteria bacterium]|nr:1-acyl-sn-glycerol-3-phosphate acyltransferase [Gammaproteobacteria bacterium]
MSQDRFADIRPYNDNEVRAVIDRLLRNPELLDAITRLRFPRLAEPLIALLRPLVRLFLWRQVAGIDSVRGFQQVVEKYMSSMVESSTSAFSVSGLERLDPARACLFIGNHRDIALDPAFVNYALYANGRDTVRIAIGDNLLTRDDVSDLMRLNKSFIVRRSAKGPRQMLAAYQELSGYICHSLLEEHSSIWIAQREGRAKDGWDRTEPAIIKMLCISKAKDIPLAEYIRALNIVPVAISYEWDPCDAAKARELCQRAAQGNYQKGEQEDVSSIARSITTPKGAVHVAFGRPLEGPFTNADEVAAAIDSQVMSMYRMHPTNVAAYRMQQAQLPPGFTEDAGLAGAEQALRERLAGLPPEHHALLLSMYANPLLNRAALGLASG